MTGQGEALVEIDDASAVGEVRRQATRIARRLGLDEETAGRAAVVGTELAGNVLKHAAGPGWCHLAARERRSRPVVRLVCADRGPGIADVQRALQDGFSTRSTPGTGLGAVRRLSRTFDLFTTPGEGTVITAEVGARGGDDAPGPQPAWDGIARPKPGQERCGDAWGARLGGRTLWVVLADGLGHGPEAATAAELAVDVALRPRPGGPGARVTAIHEGLHSTRGAAVALAAVDVAAGVVRFSGIGNVAAVVEDPAGRRNLVSMNGTAGHHARTVREFDLPWNADSVLLMHTDGLTSRWDLASRAGLLQRHPATIAAVLLRDFARGTDDAAAVVVKGA